MGTYLGIRQKEKKTLIFNSLCKRKKTKLFLKLFYPSQDIFLLMISFFDDLEIQKVFHLFHCYIKITASYTLPPFRNYQVTVLPDSKFYNFLGPSYFYQFQTFQIGENIFQVNPMLYVLEYTSEIFELSQDITLELLNPLFQTCLATQDVE